MSFNPDSIDLVILFDTKEKAEQLIKIFTEGYKQTMSSYLNSKEGKVVKDRLNSPKPIINYYGLKRLYENKIIPDTERWMKEKIRKNNPGISERQFDSIFIKEKETNLKFLRKNLEYTRLSGAFNVIKPDGELESSVTSEFGIGKATCGTCGKEKRDEEPTLGPKETKENKVG